MDEDIEAIKAELVVLRQYVEALRWFEYVVMNMHKITDEQIQQMRHEAAANENGSSLQ